MKSFVKRMIVLSFVPLISMSLLAGCGGTTKTDMAQGNTKKTISFAFWGAETEANALKSAVDAFQKSHPSIKIDAQWIQRDYTTKLQTMIAGGTVPDVILISSGDLPGFVNAFEELKVDKSKYSSANLVDALSYKGKRYAKPFIIKPKVMAINVDLFKKNNIELPSKTEPLTPEKFEEIAKKITRGEGNTKIFGSEPLCLCNWIYSFGGRFYTKDGSKSLLGSPESIKAADFIVNSKKLGYVPNDTEKQGQNMMNWFLSGRIGMFTDFGPWYLPQMNEVKNFQWDLVPFPGKGGSKEVDGLAISKISKNKDAAQIFVDYMCESNEAQKIIGGNKIAYGIPVLASATPSFETIYPDKNLKAFIIASKNQTSQESPKQINEINSAMKEIDDRTPVGIGKEDPSKVFPEVAQKIDQILQQ